MNELLTTREFVEAMQQLSDRLFASASEIISSDSNVDKIIAATLMRIANCIDDEFGPEDDEDDSDD